MRLLVDLDFDTPGNEVITRKTWNNKDLEDGVIPLLLEIETLYSIVIDSTVSSGKFIQLDWSEGEEVR